MNWTGKHRAFTMETFIKTNESVTATQRAFRVHFKLGRHDPVPSRNTILVWVNNFRANKDAIRQEIASIPHEMIRRVIDNFRERLQQCVDNNGSHLTDLIFKTKWNKMALYLLFKNKNTLLFIYIFCLLFKLQMCQIILTDPVFIFLTRRKPS